MEPEKKSEAMQEEASAEKKSELDKFIFEQLFTSEQKQQFAVLKDKMIERAKKFNLEQSAAPSVFRLYSVTIR